MNKRIAVFVFPLAVGLASCGESPVSPTTLTSADEQAVFQKKGTGLQLNSLTGLALPLLPIELGDIVIEQVVLTDFAIVEDAVGAIIGLEATGILQLTGGVLGTDVITENFTTTVSVTSSGPGQCNLVTIDLGSIAIDALGVASVDIPEASLTGKGSGAVGSLLCNIGQALSGLTGALPGLINGLNNQI